MPAEKEVVPTGGHRARECGRSDLRHGDDGDGKGGNGENAELHHLGDDDAEHAALDDVKRRDGDESKGVLVGRQVPGQEGGSEFPDALEAITEETDDADESIDNDDNVRQLRAAAFAKAGLDPLGAGHSIGTAQPRGEEDHQEDLIEGGP